MVSKLTEQLPVVYRDGQGARSAPPAQLLTNLSTLHQILGLVVDDWHHAAKSYETHMARHPQRLESVVARGFIELQPQFLKCLFSYALFFVAASEAYGVLYRSLNHANGALGLNLKHGKPPQATPLVRKARLIRDWSIAHFPSDRARVIDAHAAMSWAPMALSKPNSGTWDLRSLTFGPGRLRGVDDKGAEVFSEDLELEGLDGLHRECLTYLEAYDDLCCTYLAELHAATRKRDNAGA